MYSVTSSILSRAHESLPDQRQSAQARLANTSPKEFRPIYLSGYSSLKYLEMELIFKELTVLDELAKVALPNVFG